MKRIALLFLLLTLTGCGDGLVVVSGKVEWNQEPVMKGVIRFEPKDGLGPSAEGNVENGVYSTRISKGSKIVRVYSYVEKGRRYPFGEAAGPAIDYKQVIPAEYNDRTELAVDINGKTNYDFLK